MSGLEIFFRENSPREEKQKVMVSDRFQENNEPVKWEIKSISSAEDEMLRKTCMRKINNKKDTLELDFDLYMGKLAAVCTVYPDLKNADIQGSYKVLGADACLKEMLLPGEYAAYLEKIQEINGYSKSMEELVDEAKN